MDTSFKAMHLNSIFWFCQLCQQVLLPYQPDPPPKHFTNHIVFNNKLLEPIQAPQDTILGQLGDNFGTALGSLVHCLVTTGGAYLCPMGSKWSFFTKFSLKNSRETIDTVFLLKSTAHSSVTNFKTFLRCSLVSSINRASSSLTSKPRAL